MLAALMLVGASITGYVLSVSRYHSLQAEAVRLAGPKPTFPVLVATPPPSQRVVSPPPVRTTPSTSASYPSPTITPSTPTVRIPDVIGLPIDWAVARLMARGLQVQQENELSTAPPGSVLRTDPSAGTVIDKGAVVIVVYAKSAGPPSTSNSPEPQTATPEPSGTASL